MAGVGSAFSYVIQLQPCLPSRGARGSPFPTSAFPIQQLQAVRSTELGRSLLFKILFARFPHILALFRDCCSCSHADLFTRIEGWIYRASAGRTNVFLFPTNRRICFVLLSGRQSLTFVSNRAYRPERPLQQAAIYTSCCYISGENAECECYWPGKSMSTFRRCTNGPSHLDANAE
jgi:hypothetical protein